jgi:signal transduction histidine kinase
MRAFDDSLAGVLSGLVAAAETDQAGQINLSRRPPDSRYDVVFSGRYWQLAAIDEAGGRTPLLTSRSVWDVRLGLPDALVEQALEERGAVLRGDMLGPEKEPLRLSVQALQLPGRDDVVLFTVAADRSESDAEVRRFGLVSGGMFLGFATAIAAGVFVLMRFILAPVTRLRDEVAEVREGETDRIEGAFPNELQPLADELNSLLAHSRDIVERSRTHVGNLAHALKTPIAVLTNESRASDDELAKLVARQSEAMAEAVDHHLRRARAAAHAKALGARTDVNGLIEDLVRTLRRIYAREGVTLESELADALVFRGERQDLEEMLGNLIDNACKYSQGFVQVGGRVEDRRVLLTIEDDGPGLDEAACAAALERGVRLDETAPGAGLGLAIVADLARAYGGQLALDKSPELGGLRAQLDLPAAALR